MHGILLTRVDSTAGGSCCYFAWPRRYVLSEVGYLVSSIGHEVQTQQTRKTGHNTYPGPLKSVTTVNTGAGVSGPETHKHGPDGVGPRER